MGDPVSGAPWRLLSHRVERFYSGGALLDAFRSGAEGGPGPGATDGDRPEDWIGSATRAWTPPGAAPTEVGLSVAELADGRTARVADLLAADPHGVAGEAMVAAAGPSLGLLVKLLDAAIRLPVHAHPSRPFARRHLGSFFGKSEAWIVLGTRTLPGEPPPNVRLGFRRDIARDELRGWIEDEATEPLLDALHERPTRAGDVWFVPAGMPHAIGAGVFLLELQDPTDFSILAETRGVPIDRSDAHLRLGWDVAIDAFDRTGLTDAALASLRGPGPESEQGGSAPGVLEPLLPAVADSSFRAHRLRLEPSAAATPVDERTYLVGVVTGGRGTDRVGPGSGSNPGPPLELRRGECFAVPARASADLELEAGLDGLDLLLCRPPRGEDLGTS